MVIFGANGDLTKRLLMPALYNLSRTKLLDDKFSILGIDRDPGSDEEFQGQADRLDGELHPRQGRRVRGEGAWTRRPGAG